MVAAQGSLAAQARSVIQQASRSGLSRSGKASEQSCKIHRCRVSRCGCVAPETSRSASRPHSATRSSATQDLNLTASWARGRSQAQRNDSTACPDAGQSTTSATRRRRSPSVTLPSKALQDVSVKTSSVRGRSHARGISSFAAAEPEAPTTNATRRRRSSSMAAPAKVLEELQDSSLSTAVASIRESSSDARDSTDVPESPSNAELTEAVLRKSQYLLQQLSDLDLDSDSKASIEDSAEMDLQSECSEVSSRVATLSKLATGPETVEVPVAFLKMLAESWSGICSPRGSAADNRMRSSPPGFPKEARKESVQRRTSTSSITSAMSTVTPSASECGSIGSLTHSPLSDASERASACLAQPAQTKGASKRNVVQVRALSPPPVVLSQMCHLRALSPARAVILPQMGSTTASSSLSQMAPYRAAAMPASQTVSVTASVPPGSCVSISVTTS